MRELDGRAERLSARAGDAFPIDLTGRRIALDCANGATYRAAPAAFEACGAEVEAIAGDPDGRNINEGCGSTHPENLIRCMSAGDAEVGFAFDGDGDRVLAVDRTGTLRDGDELLALAARFLSTQGRLNGGVAVTVMSNYGFHTAMAEAGIEVDTTDVGDRHVAAALDRRGWNLGGEQSGHIIWPDFSPTGDGIAAALLTLTALGASALEEGAPMRKLPQLLRNVEVANRDGVAAAGGLLGGRGARERGARGPRARARPSLGDRAPGAGDGGGPGAPKRRSRSARGSSTSFAPSSPDAGDLADPSATSALSCLPRTALMCGIVGYVGRRPCRDLLVAGLEKLEYRGYDSAGISLLEDGHIDSVRAVGNLAEPARRGRPGAEEEDGGVAVAAPPATTGLAHTRWATHGRVTEENAHPHGDCDDRIHIVLNGIVENHAELRRG